MAHAVWKGTLEFGLVNIPVGLYPAESSDEIELRMLDSRDLSPIGYNYINKSTGETVTRSHIVKGYEYDEGRYVVLTDEELKSANAEATQTAEIVGFVDADAVPMSYYDRPYYLAPEKKGQKAYILFREALRKAGKIGIARVVLRTRQHMAAIYPMDDVIVLQLLRYAADFRAVKDLAIPEKPAKGSDIGAREIAIAVELIGKMAEPWRPAAYHDEYHDQLMAYIERKAKTGKGRPTAAKASSSDGGGKVLDLMALLKKSVEQGRKSKAAGSKSSASKTMISKAAGSRAAASKAATLKAPIPIRARKTTPKRRSA